MRTPFRRACVKAGIILGPSWLTAWLTDKMVYVVPMLAATAVFAATLDTQPLRRQVDDDGSGPDDLDQADSFSGLDPDGSS